MKDRKALRELKHAVHRENISTVRVLELIGQVEESGACLRNGQRSVFDYLRFTLKYSEGAAARRLRAARLLRLHPEVKELLALRDGKSVLRESVKPVTVKRRVVSCNDGGSRESGSGLGCAEETGATPESGRYKRIMLSRFPWVGEQSLKIYGAVVRCMGSLFGAYVIAPVSVPHQEILRGRLRSSFR